MHVLLKRMLSFPLDCSSDTSVPRPRAQASSITGICLAEPGDIITFLFAIFYRSQQSALKIYITT